MLKKPVILILFGNPFTHSLSGKKQSSKRTARAQRWVPVSLQFSSYTVCQLFSISISTRLLIPLPASKSTPHERETLKTDEFFAKLPLLRSAGWRRDSPNGIPMGRGAGGELKIKIKNFQSGLEFTSYSSTDTKDYPLDSGNQKENIF